MVVQHEEMFMEVYLKQLWSVSWDGSTTTEHLAMVAAGNYTWPLLSCSMHAFVHYILAGDIPLIGLMIPHCGWNLF